jgi:hypothetical protein
MIVSAKLIMALLLSITLIAISMPIPMIMAQSPDACVATSSANPSILDFDFSPRELNLVDTSSQVALQIHVADENGDIDSIEAVFSSPTQNQSLAAFMNSKNLHSGDARNGNYTTNISISPSCEAGIWTVERLIVCDKMGDCRRIDGAMAVTLGFPVKLQILKRAENGNIILDPNELRGWANTDKRFAAQRKIIINSVFNRPSICWP